MPQDGTNLDIKIDLGGTEQPEQEEQEFPSIEAPVTADKFTEANPAPSEKTPEGVEPPADDPEFPDIGGPEEVPGEDNVEVETDSGDFMQRAIDWMANGIKAPFENLLYAFQGINPHSAPTAPVAPVEIQDFVSEMGTDHMPTGYFWDHLNGVVRVRREEDEESAAMSLSRIAIEGQLAGVATAVGKLRAPTKKLVDKAILDKHAVSENPAAVARPGETGTSAPAKADATVPTPKANPEPDMVPEAVKVLRGSKQNITPSQARTMHQAVLAVERGELSAREAGLGRIINADYVEGAEKSVIIMQKLAKTLKPQLDASRGVETMTFEMVKQAALEMGTTPNKLLKRLEDLGTATKDMPATVLAARMMNMANADELSRIGAALDIDPNNVALQTQLQMALNHTAGVAEQLQGVTTSTARTLNAQKIKVGGDNVIENFSEDTIKRATAGEKRKMRLVARKLRLAQGRPDLVSKALRGGPLTKAVDIYNEVFISGLLSGMKSIFVNVFANQTQTFIVTPINKIVGAALTGNRQLARQAIDLEIGNFLAIKDSFKGAAHALRIEDNILDPAMRINEVSANKAISMGDGRVLNTFKDIGDGADLFANGPIAAMVNALGKVVRVGPRLMLVGDEFSKQMNYRSFVRAQALDEARKLGLTGKARAEHVFDSIENAFDGTGRATANSDALAFTRRQTFTDDIDVPVAVGTKAIGALVQEGVAKAPLLRSFAPFVRTPVNLFRRSVDQTPVGLMRREIWEELTNKGPQARAEAIGRMAVGTGIMAGTGYAVAAGHITGGGPTDPDLKREWLETHRPYSIDITFGVGPVRDWYEYRRFEPISTIIGTVADTTQVMKETRAKVLNLPDDQATVFAMVADMVTRSGSMSTTEHQEMWSGLMSALVKNVTNKNFIGPTIESISDIMSGEGYRMGRFVNRYVSTVAVPSIFNQTNSDPHLREARNWQEAVMRRLDGQSQKLDPVRNIFGEKVQKPIGFFNRSISAFTNVKLSDDKISQEIQDLGKGIPMPPETIEDGQVDLTDREKWGSKKGQSPYDRALEIMGPAFKAEVQLLIDTGAWDAMSSGSVEFPGGQRRIKLMELKQKHWDRALKAVTMIGSEEDFPKLQEKMQFAKHLKRLSDTGGQELMDQFKAILQ